MYKKLLIAGVSCLVLAQAQTQDFPGRYTFDAEGQEGGRYMSRIPHQPTLTSGVTIGRGYDMKERTPSEVVRDLTNAGVPMGVAQQLSAGAGKTGQVARAETNTLRDSGIEISPEAQRNLFDTTYQANLNDVNRILNKPDVQSTYGNINPSTLPQGVQEFLTDLRYRGDFTSASRQSLLPSLADGQKTGDYSNFWNAARQWNDHANQVPQGRRDARDQLIDSRSQPQQQQTPSNQQHSNSGSGSGGSGSGSGDKDKDGSNQTSQNQDDDDKGKVQNANYNNEDQFFAYEPSIDGEGELLTDDGFLSILPVGKFYMEMIF
jgi:hypothetical protein